MTPQTDLGNATRFVTEHHSRLRYVIEGHHWLHWNGHHWVRDHSSTVTTRAAQDTVRGMYRDALAIKDDDKHRENAIKWAKRSASTGSIRAILEQGRAYRQLAISQEDLDQHPYLLACPNGTINLKTGKLLDSDPSHLLTRATTVPYTPDAPPAHRFYRFLHEVFGGDRELIDWLRRFVGYCLTGATREHMLAVFYGTGCNGKSTLLTVLRAILGDLATTSPFETFVQSRNGDRPRNDLARLHGARLVTASESNQSRRLDEATIKEITGGDTIAARFLHQEFFEFTPAFKIVLATNHKPRVLGADEGIWRRLRLVPFAQSFEGRKDDTLDEQLRAEYPEILRWAVRGCLEWQKDGLGDAEAIKAATREYRAEEDVIGAFLDDCTTPGGTATASALYAAYEKWCEEASEDALKARTFGIEIARKDDIKRGKVNGQRGYHGVTLLATPTLQQVA
jgi:putative DNA primase/helicase